MTRPSREIGPGTSRCGPYALGAKLGAGSVATVYEATDTRTGKTVALKVLDEKSVGRRDVLGRFTREARALQNLVHPNIVGVHDQGIDADRAWIALERLHGMTLAELVRKEGRLEERRALRLAQDVARALAKVHEHGLVHRDVKPENVFVVAPGTRGEHAKILDFGIARVTAAEMGDHETQYTRTDSLLGSVAFMAPEQRGSAAVDGQADVFALGVTLYEALTGALPYEGRTVKTQLDARTKGAVVPLAARAPGVVFSPGVEPLLRTMLAPDKTARPAGGAGVVDALAALLPPPAGARVNRALVLVIVALTAIALGAWAGSAILARL